MTNTSIMRHSSGMTPEQFEESIDGKYSIKAAKELAEQEKQNFLDQIWEENKDNLTCDKETFIAAYEEFTKDLKSDEIFENEFIASVTDKYGVQEQEDEPIEIPSNNANSSGNNDTGNGGSNNNGGSSNNGGGNTSNGNGGSSNGGGSTGNDTPVYTPPVEQPAEQPVYTPPVEQPVYTPPAPVDNGSSNNGGGSGSGGNVLDVERDDPEDISYLDNIHLG